MSVLVVGSFITDLIARTEKAPEAMETVRGISFNSFPGGKGANQAIAAKRMGSDVIMVGAVGEDFYGNEFINLFKNEGFDTSYIKRSSSFKTGCSLVTVELSGQNRICMVPGANTDYSKEEISKLENEIESSNVIVTQNEMTYEVVETLSKLCVKHRKFFILNPAPASKFSDEILKSVTIITPNETELGTLVGKKLENDNEYLEASKELLSKGVKNVVVTLGAKGSLLVNEDTVLTIPARKVKTVDTVGAGDSFTGSLSAFIDQGYPLIESLKMSTIVASISVQKEGAIPSIPYRAEIDELLKTK